MSHEPQPTFTLLPERKNGDTHLHVRRPVRSPAAVVRSFWRAIVVGLLIYAIVGALFFFVVRSAHAQEYTPEDTLAAIDQAAAEIGVSEAWLTRVVGCETGGSFDPYSIGRQGELGPAQLHPRGELLRFKAWGYTDPFSPWQSIRFMAQRFALGGARAWSCA